MGNCFTLFHQDQSNLLNDIAIHSGLSQSPVIRGRGDAVDLDVADQPFRPNEVLRLKINFTAQEYTSLNSPISGVINIHDADEVPPVRERSLVIYPGYYYDFFVTKQSERLLEHPFATDCVRYTANNVKNNASDNDNEDINEYLHQPLSKTNCIIGCLASKTMQLCSCWPPELPFMLGSGPNSIENRMKWCDWNESPAGNISKLPSGSTSFRYCFSDNEAQCKTQCKSDCE